MDNIERLIRETKESLVREIRLTSERISQISSRFGTPAKRIDRGHSGPRWSNGMDAWVDKVDGALEAQDREIAELRERLQWLERRSA